MAGGLLLLEVTEEEEEEAFVFLVLDMSLVLLSETDDVQRVN